MINPFSYYKTLIDRLREIRNVKIVPLCDIQNTSAQGSRLLGLRHDIDSNPFSALRSARYLASKGICGSFYLLHTSSYYGSYEKGVLIRSPMMTELVIRFIITGCELGLHNDAFGVYTVHGGNGAECIKKELTWLKSLGVNVKGTVAHNSAPVYCAENYEIFKERILWDRIVKSQGGITLPLGELSEKNLDLKYEGVFGGPKKNLNLEKALKFVSNSSDANIRSETWMRKYLIDNPYCDWLVDYQFWLLGKDTWVAAGSFNNEVLFEWDINSERLIDIIKDLPENTRSILLIHPDYFEKEEYILQHINKESLYKRKGIKVHLIKNIRAIILKILLKIKKLNN